MITYRRGHLGDVLDLLALYEAAFHKPFSSEWWRWWSEECPRGKNRLTVAEDAGRLVGAYSLLPMDVWVGGEHVKAALCTNVCVHPDYQGRGIFTGLGQHALSVDHGTRLFVGMPNRNALPGHLRVGWREFVPLSFFVKTDCQMQPRRSIEVPAFDGRVDALMEKRKGIFSFLPWADAAWLEWRLQRTGASYTRFVIEQGTGIGGYMVTKVYEKDSVRVAHVVDLQAISWGATEDLVFEAESFAAREGCRELTLWTNPRDPYAIAFEQRGFQRRESFDRVILHGPLEIPEGPVSFNLFANDVV